MSPPPVAAAPVPTRGRRQRLPGHPFRTWLANAWSRDDGLLGPPRRRRASRALARALPGAIALLAAAGVVRGGFARPDARIEQGAVLVLLAIACAIAGARAFRPSPAGRPSTAAQAELGALLVVAAAAVAQMSGPPGGEGPLFPLVYLAAAVAVAFLSLPVGLALVGLAAALQVGAWAHAGAPPTELAGVLARVGFVLLFAILHHAVLRARLVAAGHAERAAVDRRLRELDERAQEVRLLAPRSVGEDGSGTEEHELRRGRAAAVEVEAAVAGVLEVAEAALRTHTCALFVLSPDDAFLRLRECRSASDHVSRDPLPAGEGALGAVLARRAAVRAAGDLRSATYYRDGSRPRALLAVPVVDRRGGHVRGVLLADRLDDLPFAEADEVLLGRLSGELVRAMESERILLELQAERDEKELFYEAIEQLNRKTTTPEVLDAALGAVSRIVPLDFGAITLHEPEEVRTPHHVVRAVRSGTGGLETHELEGFRFAAETGLVASAVRLGTAIPGLGERVDRLRVLDESTRLRGLSSVHVFPLLAGGRMLGTLVLGSARAGAFDGDAARRLEVIALQVADALLRARLFEQTERLASTDGLTGLSNHRTFQARLDEQLRVARRYGKKLSVVLCDVDRFKSVNDTHGHPVGDLVLRGLARVLAAEARETDLVARYGGEEFALVMPETDGDGALVIAERIRLRLEAETFPTGSGPLRVTLSLGIATFPADGPEKARLVEVADSCLYQAKRTGRNRSVRSADLSGARTP